jgi:aminopeptidase N
VLSAPNCTTDPFELDGSTEHNLRSYPITIKYMKLHVEPNFDLKEIKCFQSLQIFTLSDLTDKKVELDCVDIQVNKVSYRESNDSHNVVTVLHAVSNEKLIITLHKQIRRGTTFYLDIHYSAKPSLGFHFIHPDEYYQDKNLQGWTQGEMVESRYWFPCIDDPQIKFPREVSVVVPEDFTVISNGKKEIPLEPSPGTMSNTKVYKWIEEIPDSVYLTSIIAGKFIETKEDYDRGIQLSYYVPHDRRQYAKRSFEGTSDMMKFFETYLNVNYPYNKYSQVTAEDFEYGGMENTSCTTLEEEILLDEKAYIDDYFTKTVVSHELAHQWFGDLVTCKDWSHTWLNEGFATYCEALYIEHSEGKDEFQYHLRRMARRYFIDACKSYRRPIVTKKYKYPDELFDSHSYQKGACVLHMLRNLVGEDKFKEALSRYLEKFRTKNVDTDDLRIISEGVSGRDLKEFFEQWLYKPGHPQLNIEFTDVSDSNHFGYSIKVTQVQHQKKGEELYFSFPLEVKAVFSNKKEPKFYKFDILAQRQNILDILMTEEEKENIRWISIDPEFKIPLREILYYSFPNYLMLLNQLKYGETAIEGIDAINGINYAQISDGDGRKKIIKELKNAILNDNLFWGVSAAAALKLGSLKNDMAYEGLKESLRNSVNIRNHRNRARIRTNIVSAIGNYIPYKPDAFDILNFILILKGDESYRVETAALTALSNYRDERSFKILKKAVDTPNTFNDIIPIAATTALTNFAQQNSYPASISEVISIITQKTKYGYSNALREAAVSGLNNFILSDQSLNKDVFNTLYDLLNDKWYAVRLSACADFGKSFSYNNIKKYNIEDELVNMVIDKLAEIAKSDLSSRVRRAAELSLKSIKEPPSGAITALAAREMDEYTSGRSIAQKKRVLDPVSEIIYPLDM